MAPVRLSNLLLTVASASCGSGGRPRGAAVPDGKGGEGVEKGGDPAGRAGRAVQA
ncbi:hypothetical protein GCM10027161_19620 [Microbispora hainanensis]